MNSEIDKESLDHLRRLRGRTILQVTGARYPGVAGYSEVRLVVASSKTLALTLRIEDVDDELEVCVPVVRSHAGPAEGGGADRFKLAGFRVADLYKLQRRESIEWAAEDKDYVGSHPREHRMAEVDAGDSPGSHLVDAGVAVVSADGLSLELYADSFPLVYQLRLTVMGTAVPEPRRIPLT